MLLVLKMKPVCRGIILIVILSGCTVKSGVITRKWHIPRHEISVVMPDKDGANKVYTVTHLEKWNIIIEGYNKRGKLRKRTMNIKPYMYLELNIGDLVAVENGMIFKITGI